MKYFSWALAVLGVCGVLGFSAYHFNKPEILLGLIGLIYLPDPFDEYEKVEDDEPEDESGQGVREQRPV